MSTEKEFADGIWFKEPDPKAPDFVLGAINIRREDFMKFLAEKDGDYVNLKVLRSRAGKPYVEVDNWKPSTEPKPVVDQREAVTGKAPADMKLADIANDDIPF